MPLFHTRDGNPAFLKDHFKDQSCFYIGGGPSLLTQEEELKSLSSRGICTLAVNNSGARFVRPTLWTAVDSAWSFHEYIWRDPGIMKFYPNERMRDKYLSADRTKKYASFRAPNQFFFQLSSEFNHETFLTEKWISWGCDKRIKDSLGIAGGRSVMLVALKILYYLGFKKVYLLGCDFNMPEEQPYAFEQHKWEGGCKSNNDCYRIMNKRFKVLRKIFEDANYTIINCTPNSRLEVFDRCDFVQCIQTELAPFKPSIDLSNLYSKKKCPI